MYFYTSDLNYIWHMSNNSTQGSLVPVLTQKGAHVKNKKCRFVSFVFENIIKKINTHTCFCIERNTNTRNFQGPLHCPEALGNTQHHVPPLDTCWNREQGDREAEDYKWKTFVTRAGLVIDSDKCWLYLHTKQEWVSISTIKLSYFKTSKYSSPLCEYHLSLCSRNNDILQCILDSFFFWVYICLLL